MFGYGGNAYLMGEDGLDELYDGDDLNGGCADDLVGRVWA